MSVAETVQTTVKGSISSSSSGFVLQRKCACGGSAGFAGECAACRTNKLLGKPLLAKLRITALSDEYELEADRIAEAVMRMPDVPVDHEASHSSPVPLVYHRVNGSGTAGAGTAPQLVHDVVTSPGQPLDAAMRDFLEPRFGHNLAHVRVHADSRAHLAAESVHARAFTVGSHIVFGAGEYVPTSIASRQLLAHEVTHALQQTGGAVPSHNAQRAGSVATPMAPTHGAPVIARKASPAFQQQDHIADQSSTAALDQSAMAAAEVVLGAQVDALFDDQAEMGAGESAQHKRTLTRDRSDDEDEKTREQITSIQAKSPLPGERDQPHQSAEEVAEPQGIVFGPEPSPMASASTSEPAPVMPITSPAEAGRWFNDLPPSVQAEQYAQLSGALSGSLRNQAVETQEDIPELSASLKGVGELPATPDIATPPVMPSAAGQTLAMAPEPVVNIPQAPALQSVDAVALPTTQAADPQALEQALKGIDQSSPITTTLETPQIPLEGKANPALLEELESAATGEAQQALDKAQAGVMVVTPEILQPQAFDEIVGSPALAEVSVPEHRPQVEGMDTLAGYGLSPRDRAIVDAQLGPSMQEQTAGAQAELDQHEQEFDQERGRLHLEADAEAEAAQAKAEEEQRLEIERGREDLAVQQERTLEQQQAAVDGALGQLALSQQENRQAIDDRLADDRALVDEAYAAAKVDANARVEQGKAEADAAKRGTIDKVEGSSWWDWAIDTWQAVVQTVAAAVVAIGQRIVKEVAGIFDKTIAFATQVVNGAVAFIKSALSAYYDFWIGLVDRLLGDIFPGFAAAFRQVIESLKAKVFEALDTVAATYLGALRFVADTFVAGLNAGLEAYKAGVAAYIALWEAIQNGQWEEVGRMVLTPILRAAGIDPEEFFATFGKIDEVIDDVIANPGLVGQNAVKALGLGFTQFGRNFIGNFLVAFVEWITGAAAIVMPKSFSLAGIFDVTCQILNLTKAYLRKKAVQHLGEGAVTAVEELTESAWAFVSGGWAGLWNLVKDKLTSLVDDVVVATGTWLVEKAILVAGRWIAGLAATMGLSVILEALIALWQFVMWLKDQFQRFWMIVQSTVDSVHDFVKGKIEPAANKIEGTLQDLIVPAIDLVAKLLNISNIAKKVEQIIEAVRGVIDRAIDGVILSLKKKLKAGVKTVKLKATAVGGRLLNWWNAKSEFKDESGESHTLFYKDEAETIKLYVASTNPTYIEPFLRSREERLRQEPKPENFSERDLLEARTFYETEVKAIHEHLEEINRADKREKLVSHLENTEELVRKLDKALMWLGVHFLRRFFDHQNERDYPPPRLPVMSDYAKAKSFRADYIVAGTRANGYRYRVKMGTPSGAHRGSLGGWEAVETAGFTRPSRFRDLGQKASYVKMHLLPHKLGGDAVDSNLTPAPSEINSKFSHDVEQPAIQASTEGVEEKRRPIWYRFHIAYYPPGVAPQLGDWPSKNGKREFPSNSYPQLIKAEWGYYGIASGETEKPRLRVLPAEKTTGDVRIPLPGYDAFGTDIQIAEGRAAEKAGMYAKFFEEIAELSPTLKIPIEQYQSEVNTRASEARTLAQLAWSDLNNYKTASDGLEGRKRPAEFAEDQLREFVLSFGDAMLGVELKNAFKEKTEKVISEQRTRSEGLKKKAEEKKKELSGKNGRAMTLYYLIGALVKSDVAKESTAYHQHRGRLLKIKEGTDIGNIKKTIDRLIFEPEYDSDLLHEALRKLVTAVREAPFNGETMAGKIHRANEIFSSGSTPSLIGKVSEQVRMLEDLLDDYNNAVEWFNMGYNPKNVQHATAVMDALPETASWVKGKWNESLKMPEEGK